MRGEDNKGKLIYESSPASKPSRIAGILFFFVFFAGFFAAVFAIIFYPTPASASWLGYHWPDILISGGILSGAFLVPPTFFGMRCLLYENGITLPVSLFYNIFRRNKEGRFLPYGLIMGYDKDFDDPESEKKNKRGAISIFYWDNMKKGIRMALFGQNLKDVEVVEENFLKNGVKPVPQACPNCGKKLLGFDYLKGKCQKCRTEIFDMSVIKEEE